MLRDVFYFNKKPNVHPREQYAENLQDARLKATTRDFWIINEFSDYSNFDWDFDFEFLPDEDVWAEEHNNVWPSQHQKDSGTWLCPKKHSDIVIYRNDIEPVKRKKEKTDNWVELDLIDYNKFDFSWHPDPTDPPYIYKWGCKYFPVEFKHVLEYRVPGATQEKYMTTIVELLPETDRWTEHQLIDKDKFDLSWRPNPLDPPFIYIWGNKYIDGKTFPTLEYHMPGAIDKKFVNDLVPLLPNILSFELLEDIDKSKFDFTWRPNPTSSPYIYAWGNQWNSPEDKISVQYIVPGATEYKYMTEKAVRKPCMDNWVIPDNIDTTDFDFSWEPKPASPPYIYEFATQWQKTGGPQYIVPGATEKQYIDFQKVKRIALSDNWSIPNNIDITDFDFSWHPDNTEPAYIYQFGTQWSITGGPIYTVPGAAEVKYVDDQVATAKKDMTNWVYDSTEIDIEGFDFSWHPYIDDKPYIYQFGTQHQKTGGPRYITPGADSSSSVKYVDTRILKARRLPNKNNFRLTGNYRVKNFDYSWHPDDTSPPYIYVFGNNLYPAEECVTIEYRVAGATETKFINDIVATLDINMDNWEIPTGIEVSKFDFSWLPHPASPPYIYQFGTKLDNNDGPKYVTPNNTEEIVYLPRIEIEHIDEPKEIVVGQYYVETSLEDLVKQHPNEVFWALNKNIDYNTFDFTWRPGTVEVAWELEYVHVFGSSESESTHTYFVSAKHFLEGKTSFKYVDDMKLTYNVLSDMFIKPDMFFVDRGNNESVARFEALKAKFGTRIQKTRYLNSWVDTIGRCTNRSTSELIWVLNSELDYNDFNFDYYPNPWQMKMVHVFGTQWSHWGTTFMVNVDTFREDSKHIKIIEHLSNLNFVKDRRAKATKCVHDIFVIDHGNREVTDVVNTLQNKAPGQNVNIVKYNSSYLDTLKGIIMRQPEKKENFIWICSSVCDYTNFDFTYICDPFARDNLHVFPSGKQKFGDTFFIDVNNAKKVIGEIDDLENYTKVNYNTSVKAERLPEPTIIINDDTHTTALDKITDFPYATFITGDNYDIDIVDVEPMNLWSEKTKNIYVTSTGATRIIAPKEIKDHIKKELYEYPYIKRAPKLSISKPLDIVFLSNGETGADKNYEHLLNTTKNLSNRVVRVDGINGRVAAYHAAAAASETPWFFTVFAKLHVSPKFDFNWQPDRMQSPKHYIFHAKNPVNGLVYGHQAMIAYNKKLNLANQGYGLDFTLDDEHEVVPLISGTANYNTDEFSTWRTAFREVIKLKADYSDAARERLDVWLNKAQGDFAQYSIKGALDADEYYDNVDGSFQKIKLSYEWDWLRNKFEQI